MAYFPRYLASKLRHTESQTQHRAALEAEMAATRKEEKYVDLGARMYV